MTGLLDSPVRNLTFGSLYVVLVMVLATGAYMSVGWSFRDAIYMVIVTVYTVGYNEVRPINTPALNLITIALSFVRSEPVPSHGREHSLSMTLPPLAVVLFARARP